MIIIIFIVIFIIIIILRVGVKKEMVEPYASVQPPTQDPSVNKPLR